MSNFWDGTGGAIIGATLSSLIALFVIVRTRRDERELMREQLSITAAYEAISFTLDVSRRITPFIVKHEPDAMVDWPEVGRFIDTAEADSERFYAYRTIIRPSRIENQMGYVWEELANAEDKRSVVSRGVRNSLDEWARDLGQGLSNIVESLEFYLRADLERREIARQPIWKRFKPSKKPPFVRRARHHEIVVRDEYGLPKADY